MEKTIGTYSPGQAMTFSGQSMNISLNIDPMKYTVPLHALFDVAVRDNPKRRFLFVSKVLGKHIPIQPLTLKAIGALLAGLWLEQCGVAADLTKMKELSEILVKLQQINLSAIEQLNCHKVLDNLLAEPVMLAEKTLFIGFAETATGIAQSVFSNFSNASYIHTTREQLEGMAPSFVFNEEHSHAVEHALYPLDEAYLSSFERIVLIDDELTTGKTAVNLMKKLPGKCFGLISILDWRSNENLASFEDNEELSIKTCSLLKGTIASVEEHAVPNFDELFDLSSTTAEQSKLHKTNEPTSTHANLCLTSNHSINGWLSQTGRFGLSAEDNIEVSALINNAATALQQLRIDGPCLCLGTEEFIYVPCRIAEQLGNEVSFHSTTRSPIFAKAEADYCIKHKVRFPSPFKPDVVNHVYNIPFDHYKQAFLFIERPLSKEAERIFLNLFAHFNIRNTVFVSWR